MLFRLSYRRKCAHFLRLTLSKPRGNMGPSAVVVLASRFCALFFFCICCLQTVVIAWTPDPPLHLVYYVQEIRGGPNSSTLPAAGTGQGNVSAIGWGSFIVYEDLLTEGPATDSEVLGIITGSAVITTKGGIPSGGIQISAQHIFNEASKYNGSSITVTGTIESPLGPPWECIVPGGTGYFRGYQGYGLIEPVAAYTVPPLFVDEWNFYLSKH